MYSTYCPCQKQYECTLHFHARSVSTTPTPYDKILEVDRGIPDTLIYTHSKKFPNSLHF